MSMRQQAKDAGQREVEAAARYCLKKDYCVLNVFPDGSVRWLPASEPPMSEGAKALLRIESLGLIGNENARLRTAAIIIRNRLDLIMTGYFDDEEPSAYAQALARRRL